MPLMEKVGILPGGREVEYECPKCFWHVRRPIPRPGDRMMPPRIFCHRCHVRDEQKHPETGSAAFAGPVFIDKS